jgi:hypothetical protein
MGVDQEPVVRAARALTERRHQRRALRVGLDQIGEPLEVLLDEDGADLGGGPQSGVDLLAHRPVGERRP